jgi:hypothetical protein
MLERYHKSLLIPVWVRVACLPLLQCALTSPSECGAELKLEDPFAVPDRFELLFSPVAQTWRECSVNWRRYEAKSIGIRFVARHIAYAPVAPHSKPWIFDFALGEAVLTAAKRRKLTSAEATELALAGQGRGHLS